MSGERATAGAEAADALVARHQKMLSGSVQGDLPAAEIAGFVDEIAAAGAATPAGSSRDALRDILYFWAGDLANRGERTRDAPLPKLAPFAGTADPGPRTETSLPQPPSIAPDDPILPMRARGSTSILRGIEKLIRRSPPPPAAAPDPDGDVEREARARSILRLAALARQWRTTKDAETRHGYLLTGKALTEASLYVEEDADIRALVEASQDAAGSAERRRRNVRRAFVTLLILALGGAALAIYFFEEQQKKLLVLELQEQQIASIGIARERDNIRRQARRAIDALERDDIAPLRRFLQDVGDANPDELARLRLDPAPAGPLLDIASQKKPQKAAWASPPRQAGPEDDCKGFLWLGSKDDSRLADKRDPSALKPGESVALDNRSDIRLRTDWPNPDTYAMSAQNGLVPAGAIVTITSETRAFRAGQVWAAVSVPREYCTTAFLQYAGPATGTAPVLAALHQLGIQTPPAEQVATAKGLAEVRYFWPEDRAVSERAAAALRSALPGRNVRLLALTNFPTKPPSGTIEVWMDLGG